MSIIPVFIDNTIETQDYFPGLRTALELNLGL